MRYFLMLAAAASLAACHNRSEDETGAAPQRDTTAVAADTAQATPSDTTMGQTPSPTDTTAVPQDTTAVPSTPTDTTAAPSTPTDTTSATPGDTSSAGGWSDSTNMGHDSTSMSMPADSAKQ
jgi:hypothetical protein